MTDVYPRLSVARFAVGAAARSVLGLAVLGLAACSSDEGNVGQRSPYVQAYRITDRNQLIGGPAAIANIGDFILENDEVRIAVLGAFESFGPGLYGGSIVDADLQRPDGSSQANRGRDELTEVFPILDIRVQLPGAPDGTVESVYPVSSSVQVLEAGGERAVVRMEAGFTPLIGLAGIISAGFPLPPTSLHLVQDYILVPGRRALEIRSEIQYREKDATTFTPQRRFEVVYSDEPLVALLPILLGSAYGDIAIFGGKTTLFSPDFGFDFFTTQLKLDPDPALDRVFDERVPFRDTLSDPLTGQYLVGVGERMSYGMTAPAGITSIPLTASTITPQFYGSSFNLREVTTGEGAGLTGPTIGDSVTYSRYFIVGEGDVASVLDHVYDVRGTATGFVRGQALEAGTAAPLSRAQVLVFAHPRGPNGQLIDPAGIDLRTFQLANSPKSSFLSDVRADDTVADGSFSGHLAPGDYLLVGLSAGRGRSQPLPITVRPGETTTARVEIPRTGRVRVSVVDPTQGNRAIPAKLTVVELDGHGVPWSRFGEGSLPIARIPRVGGIYEPQFYDAARTDLEFISTYAFTSDGRHVFELDPGRYRVYASRGYEYGIDVKEVAVAAGLEGELQMAIARQIDTTGWVSGDFHIHSEGSHDSACTKVERVLGYASEGVEFMTSTDHDYFTNYEPYIEQYGLREYLSTSVGDELTTFEVGHYNAFPLRYDESLQSNGAPRWLDLAPPQIFEALEAVGENGPDETVTILNHPRDSLFGLYSQFGFDQGTGELCPGTFTLGNPIIRESIGGAAIGPVREENFCIDCFVAMEVLNGKRYELIRTPTLEEVPVAEADQARPLDPVPFGTILTRTLEEQRRILAREDTLAVSDQSRYQGGLDDFFTTLNLGARPVGLASSDSHKCKDTASVRSWMRVGTDLPSAVGEREVVDAIAGAKVTMGTGAFVTTRIGPAQIGDTTTDADGVVDLDVRVEGADWFQVDRVEVYGNGELVAERAIPRPNASTVKFDDRFTIDVRSLAINDFERRDTYFVVVAFGDDDLFPVNFPDHLPAQNTSDIILGALGGLIPGLFSVENQAPLTFNNLVYSITNPIFVDVDGDGRYTAPGRPPADGQDKLPCSKGDGVAPPEQCGPCDSLAPANTTAALSGESRDQALRIAGYARWIQALDQIHGRLKASPPQPFETAGRR